MRWSKSTGGLCPSKRCTVYPYPFADIDPEHYSEGRRQSALVSTAISWQNVQQLNDIEDQILVTGHRSDCLLREEQRAPASGHPPPPSASSQLPAHAQNYHGVQHVILAHVAAESQLA